MHPGGEGLLCIRYTRNNMGCLLSGVHAQHSGLKHPRPSDLTTLPHVPAPCSGCTARDLDLIVINRPARALERLMYGTAALAAEYDTPYDRSPAVSGGGGADRAEPHGQYHHAEDPEDGDHLEEQQHALHQLQLPHNVLGGHRRRADTGVRRSGSFAPGHGDPAAGPSPFMRAYLAANTSGEDGPAGPAPAAAAAWAHSSAITGAYEEPGTPRDRWGGERPGNRAPPRRSLSEAPFRYLHPEEDAAPGLGQGTVSAAGSRYTPFGDQGRSRGPMGRCYSTSAALGAGADGWGTSPVPIPQEDRTPTPVDVTPREAGWGGRDSRLDDGGGVVESGTGARRGASASSLPPPAPAPGFSCPPAMHDLVPLSDGELPLPASRLHVRQVGFAIVLCHVYQ